MQFSVKTIFLFFFIAVYFQMSAQESFVKQIHSNYSPPIPLLKNIAINKNTNQIGLFGSSEDGLDVPFYFFSSSGEIEASKIVSSPVIDQFLYGTTFQRNGNYFLYATNVISSPNINSSSIIFVFNPYSNLIWAKNNSIAGPFEYSAITTNHIIGLRTHNSKQVLYKVKVDNGENVWSFTTEIQKNNTELPFKAFSFIESLNKNLYILSLNEITKIGLTNLSPSGNILKSIQFHAQEILSIIHYSHITSDNVGNIYVPLKVKDEEQNTSGVILKFTSDLDFVWAKKLEATAFSPMQSLNISGAPNNGVFFSYSTHGNFPIITGKISGDGELEWTRGYAFSGSAMDIGNDGSIFFADYQKYNPDGSTEPGFIFAKTTPDGDIESCPQFDACLELVDIDITTEDLTWTQEPAPFLEDIPIEMTDFDFSVEDFCGTPTPPTADFVMPDTICQYTCISPSELKNNLAHEVRWNIFAPNFDTTIVDSTFAWCFDEPGEYLIEQEVWLLGCAEIFPHQLTVLSDDLALPLGDDLVVCQEGEQVHTLEPMSSRPLVSFDWSTGETTPSIQVSEAGTYALSVSDGFCEVEDIIEVSFALEDIAVPYFELPTHDTLICPDLLPFSFTPTSQYTDSFFVDGMLVADISLIETGTTTVSALINGCEVQQDIRFQVESCKIPIFLPNAFSPNFDGINDFVSPYGEDYEGVSLQVFDRWGSLVFQSDNAPFRWAGTSNGQKADIGVYVVSFTYLNRRNLTEEVIVGDVVLVR